MKEHYGCVYKIVCKINGKLYIGQTIMGIEIRWRGHCNKANYGPDKDRLHISRAIKKYGKENFRISVICYADFQEELNNREKLCIRIFNSISNGYNIHEGGKNQRLSAETKQKISDGNKGKKRSEESKERYRQSRLGTTQPKHVKIKCSESQKGEKSSWFGRKHLEESKIKIGIGNTGKKVSEESKLKNSLAHKGKKASKETKQKMSIKRQGRKPNQRKVKCLTNGLVYDSVTEAALSLGISIGYIHLGLKNKTPMKGYVLEYV